VRSFSPGQKLRLGGMVEKDSIRRDGQKTSFSVTDGKQKLNVVYEGALPDLFREGQGVVAEGHLQGNLFKADMVLAKHDENYMPRDVAEALKKQGYWQENGSRSGVIKK
jgi:cytochrome c-type biogenesis protein CcmE